MYFAVGGPLGRVHAWFELSFQLGDFGLIAGLLPR
jgi:hypothetical protein